METARWRRPALAALLLCASLGIGFVTFPWGVFCDEGENLLTGDLLRQGWRLYGDVFTHHFPLPYYWSALAVSLVGRSVLAVRLLLLLCRTAAFGLAMWAGRRPLTLAGTALAWSLLAPLYNGNHVIYPVFSGLAVLVLFAGVLSILEKQAPAGAGRLLVIGGAASVALLCDPLMVYPVGVALVILLLAERSWKAAAIPLGILLGAGVLLVAHLQVQGTLSAFWECTVLFNHHTYGLYLNTDPILGMEILERLLTGLNVLDPRWVQAGFLPDQIQSRFLDCSVVTGLAYRLAVLLFCLRELVRRRPGNAAFAYIFSATLIARFQSTFRTIPFVLVALLLSVRLLEEALAHRPSRRRWRPDLGALWGVLSGALLLVLCGWTALVLIHQRDRLIHRTDLADSRHRAAELRRLAQGRSDVRAVCYPGSMTSSFLAGLPPPNRYPYLWPWVADRGLEEVIDSLGQGPVIVHLPDQGKVWRFYYRDYLAPLYRFLSEEYAYLGDGFYVSPGLVEQVAPLRQVRAPPSLERVESPSRPVISTLLVGL